MPFDLKQIKSGLDSLAQLERENEMTKLGFAHVIFEKLVMEIKDFQKSLNPDEEIAAYIASFGEKIMILIDTITYSNPYLIIFKGIDAQTKEKVRLVQHTSQISVLFIAVKIEDSREPHRIGFNDEYEENNDEER